MELNFRIIHILRIDYLSDEERTTDICRQKEQLKQHIEECGLIEVNISNLKEKKSTDEDYNEIEEFVFQVHAKYPTGFDSQCNKIECYNDFLKRWKASFMSQPAPIVTLYESDYFNASHLARHISKAYTDVSFGVLPYNGEFHKYACLPDNPSGSDESSVFLGCADFFHDTRHLNIQYRDFEITSSYNNIRNIIVNIDSNPREIFFDLANPPIVYKVERKKRRDAETLFVNHRTMSLKYWIDIDVFGRSNVMRVSLVDIEAVHDIISKLHLACGEKPVHYAHIDTLFKQVPVVDEQLRFRHFGCEYLMTAIFKRNFTVAAQAEDLPDNIRKLKEFCKERVENARRVEKVLTLVLAAVDSGKMVDYWREISAQYRTCFKLTAESDDYLKYVVPENCRMIRRSTVTPTRLVLFAPEVMLSNRILRNFDPEYSLRVSFRDDDNTRLSFKAVHGDEEVLDYAVRQPITKGVYISGRRYAFLAWSNSQIREHCVWMYAEDPKGNTVKGIRLWMGNLSHIHTVSKYMARMGQCFSQTEDTVSLRLAEGRVRTEDDILRGHDFANDGRPYCFSDGVGRISTMLAIEVRSLLGHDKVCSAFQIRYGGYKGMLVEDPTLKDVDIVFRKSMKKFDSPHSTMLEIARTSSPTRLQLNRPIITLLNGLGVPHRTFLRLQEDVLKNLTDILFEEKKAAVFLQSSTLSDLFGYKEMSRSGIYLTTEPFFRRLLLAVHRLHVDKIKKKSNIPIDPSEGRYMLGVLDETAQLQEGQVFVQFTKDITLGETTRDTEILDNVEVLVTKNPCLLPGDVRKFLAVDIPELHHIVDCIVFPQKGRRPHSNEMAGSDMDGDEYAVLWNKDLIFRGKNHAAGHFPSVSKNYLPSITERDIVDFLIKYIKQDQVGSIANAHLALADDLDIFHEKCLEIARKFSIAVDFAKSGVSEHLDADEKPRRYPDFMEKYHRGVYKSQKALGHLFRVAHDYESESASTSVTYKDIQVDEDLKFPGWEKYEEGALKSKQKFNAFLKGIFRNYGVQHESEAYSGSFPNLHSRFRERRDRAEVEIVVVRCIKSLIKTFQEEFLAEFKGGSYGVEDLEVGVMQKASAWYVVTYRNRDAEYLSFPWTVYKFLASIKLKRGDLLPSHISPIVYKMSRQMEVCESRAHLPLLSPEEESAFEGYVFVCDPKDAKLAFRTLVLWVGDEKLLQIPDDTPHEPGELVKKISRGTLVDLFLHVAVAFTKYALVKSDDSVPVSVQADRDVSCAAIFLDFLKFCVTLRCHETDEISQLVPFDIHGHATLSNRAVRAYHTFAVLGKFSNLYHFVDGPSNTDENARIQMRAVQIESYIFPRVPISPELLEDARQVLVDMSGADEVILREIRLTKKVVVDAVGTEAALGTLRQILEKERDELRMLFAQNAKSDMWQQNI